MFGIGKKRAAVGDAERYCRKMFAGLEQLAGKSVPNQVFGDPYVYGFLQQLVMHATFMAYGGRAQSPQLMASVMANTMDHLTGTPGMGSKLISAAAEIVSPDHPFHQNYAVGREEGGQYVVALLNGDENTMRSQMASFRDFVARNYLAT